MRLPRPHRTVWSPEPGVRSHSRKRGQGSGGGSRNACFCFCQTIRSTPRASFKPQISTLNFPYGIPANLASPEGGGQPGFVLQEAATLVETAQQTLKCSVRDSKQDTAQHRATMLQREGKRQRLERLFGWRLSAYYQRLRVYYRRWRHRLSLRSAAWGVPFENASYAAWVREEERLLGSAADYSARIAALALHPTVSILLAVRDPRLPWLEESIASVLAQFYPHWELWLGDVNSPVSTRFVLEQYQDRDARIKVVPFPSSTDAASVLNRALTLATGEFIGLLAQHDTLAPHALYEVVRCLQDNQGDLLYSDEDTIDAVGQRSAPFCKPDWSPDLCLASLYACRFGVYRKQIVEAVGGFRPASAESLDYDLLLRCSERSERIIHVPRILYHKRQAHLKSQQSFSTAHASAKQAVSDALIRRAEAA